MNMSSRTSVLLQFQIDRRGRCIIIITSFSDVSPWKDLATGFTF